MDTAIESKLAEIREDVENVAVMTAARKAAKRLEPEYLLCVHTSAKSEKKWEASSLKNETFEATT